MKLRILIYFLASFCMALAGGISDRLTAAGWAQLVIFALGTACTAVIALLDKTAAQLGLDALASDGGLTPPVKAQPPRLPLIIAILGLAFALSLSSCTTAQRSQLRADGKAIIGFAEKTATEAARASLEAAIRDAINGTFR